MIRKSQTRSSHEDRSPCLRAMIVASALAIAWLMTTPAESGKPSGGKGGKPGGGILRLCVTIDEQLMQAANLADYEQVDVLDITNGNRLTTYVIKGESGSGIICLNGAAARLVHVGDLVIIVSYADYHEDEIKAHRPVVITVDENNAPCE